MKETIDEQTLIDQLQALAAQKREAEDQLRRIDGAEQVVRHLLGLSQQRRQAAQAEGSRPAPGAAAQDETPRHALNGAA